MTDPLPEGEPGLAISVSDVGKQYDQDDRTRLLLGRLLRPFARRPERFWALRGVTFEVTRGETLGIVGRNGSGKTTMLRLLAGVTAPSEGRVDVRGAVAPLIGVGVGFDPELTGVENIEFNGRLLGMTSHLLARRFDEIVEFSELGAFIDTAVKFYSSGMFLRLAFSIAIHTEPEILLVDEILAVGDLAFQAKCVERMRRLQASGMTIVVVTHNLDTVYRMCDRAIVLDRGAVRFEGDPQSAVRAYHGVLHEHAASLEDLSGAQPRTADVKLHMSDDDGGRTTFETGQPFEAVVDVDFFREVIDPIFGVSISLPGHGMVHAFHGAPGDYRGEHGPGRPLHFRVAMINNLLPGRYTVQAAVLDPGGTDFLGSSLPASMTVTSQRRTVGLVDMAGRFVVDGRTFDPSPHETLRTRPDSQHD